MREELRIKQLYGVPASLTALSPKCFRCAATVTFPVYLAGILDVKFTTAGSHLETEKGEYGTLRFI